MGQARHLLGPVAAAPISTTVRKARAAVKIPPEYIDLQQPLSVTPGAVEDAFIKANPGLSPADIAVGCDKKRLTEIRLCFVQGSAIPRLPRSRQAQLAGAIKLIMPPVRGG